jgi:hypothetical protein
MKTIDSQGREILSAAALKVLSVANATAGATLGADAQNVLALGLLNQTSPGNQTLKPADCVGSNLTGADLTIAAGKGTGNGYGGFLRFQTAPARQ